MSVSKLYVIGKKGEGVILVRTSPLRAATISHDTILAYESVHPGVDGYAKIAAAAKSMLLAQDGQSETSLDQAQIQGIEALVAGGTIICESDFVLQGAVVDSGWVSNRVIVSPLGHALEALGPDAPVSGELFNAILSDSPNSAV